jgi:hypothetical protein
MNADNRIMVRISTAKKEAFMNKVKQEGKNASEVLLELIDSYLGVSGRYDELEERLQTLKEELTEELREEFKAEIALLKEKLLGESVA